jgi:DNA-binding CsgD family transcriptional regulator
MALADKKEQRLLKTLTEREREVLEVVCQHPELQLQEIVAQGLIRKEDGEPIKLGTLKSYMQRLYNKLHIESRDRMVLHLEYCHLLEPKDTPGLVTRLTEFFAHGLKERRMVLIASIATICLIILAVRIFWPKPSPTIPCENIELAQEIFPQLEGIVLLTPFSDREHSAVFRCEGVRDSSSQSIHLSFEDSGEPEQYGFFGIGGFNGLDISSIYSELCVLVRADEDDPTSFWLNMKDVAESEGRVRVEVPATSNWEKMCVELSQYDVNQGVDLGQLANISFGFDNRTGSADLWIGGLEFR